VALDGLNDQTQYDGAYEYMTTPSDSDTELLTCIGARGAQRLELSVEHEVHAGERDVPQQGGRQAAV
jgi:hypothetical protein